MSERPFILVVAPDLVPRAVELLRDYQLAYLGMSPGEDEIARACAEREPVAIIVRSAPITARILEASPRLRVVAKHGTGTDAIDRKTAASLGIEVRTAAGANSASVAEHAWALILACAKNLVALDGRMRAGHWDKATHRSFELCGKTLGVVGLGAVGARVARLGIAFGMRALAFDPFVKSPPADVALTTLEDLLGASHVVSLHCPLTDDTRHLVNRASLAKMRDGAILVNTGRGGLVDDAALAEALASGKLRAAGLDAFAGEPLLGEHRYRAVANTVLTPHVGGSSADAIENVGVLTARNVLEALGRQAA